MQGWTDYVRRVLARESPEVRPRLAVQGNLAGRIIAAEWPKENMYRHIHSRPDQGYPNMQNYVERFTEAIRSETGDGRAVEQLLDTTQRLAEKAVRGDHLTEDGKVWK